jgi:hypothetical protein
MKAVNGPAQQLPNNGFGGHFTMQIGELVEIPLDGSGRIIAAHGPPLYGSPQPAAI